MKNWVLAVFLLFGIQGFAQQSWVEQGSVWHYGMQNIMYSGVYELTYTNDTIILGENCQKIRGAYWEYEQIAAPPAPPTITGSWPVTIITYNSSDTVFYFRNNTFYPLYIFSANIGDEWPLFDVTDTCCHCPSVNIKVIDKGTTIISGQTLRWLDVGPADSSSTGYGITYNTNRIIEKIGNTGGFFLPAHTYSCIPPDTTLIVEQFYTNFRCFNSPTISYTKVNDCDDILAVEENRLANTAFSLYPNPANGLVNITTSYTKSYQISLFDITGKVVRVENNKAGNIAIDVSNLNSGIYILQIATQEGLINKKLLVE